MQNFADALHDPALRERWRELTANGQAARELAAPLDPHQFWWRASQGSWSVAECLEHLVLAGQAHLEVIDEAVVGAHAEGRSGSSQSGRGWLGRFLVDAVEPPVRLRIPAPRRIRPERPEDPEAAGLDPLERFLELREEIGRRLKAADGLDTGAVRVRSPFVPLVRISLDAEFAVVTGHERRHLWQARRVLGDRRFPGG